ncbi:MAG: 50S ribosomal protein L11 methyltransferase [Thermomicrobiales bacterium]|nr:50S ribosomal protein L11 methyltransferase [Thermomicrobiales bacterium]
MTETGAAGEWLELIVEADREAVESVAELFGRYGYNEGVVIDEPFRQDRDGDNLAIDPTMPVTVRTYVASETIDETTIDAIRSGLRSLGMIRPVGELTIERRHEEDWANTWKEHYHPVKVGLRTVVRPPWREYEPVDDEIVVIVDPGMAFGNGTHQTTRLALQGLERFIEPGMSVFDAGTGSGILAIAAARLGASLVDGVDIDPVSVRTARENVERNEPPVAIDLRVGSVGPDQPFAGNLYDFVLANIIARVLMELNEGIVAFVKPGGTLVLSGIIEDRLDETLAVYAKHPLDLIDRRQEDDWLSLVYRKRA